MFLEDFNPSNRVQDENYSVIEYCQVGKNEYIIKKSQSYDLGLKECCLYLNIQNKTNISPKMFGYNNGYIVIERMYNSKQNKLFLNHIENLLTNIYELNKLGIVHGDLKAENVLFLENGSTKIIDYDISELFLYTINKNGVNHLTAKSIQPPDSFIKDKFLDGIFNYKINRKTYNFDIFGVGNIIVRHYIRELTNFTIFYTNGIFYKSPDNKLYLPINSEILNSLNPELLYLLSKMLEIDSETRWNSKQCLYYIYIKKLSYIDTILSSIEFTNHNSGEIISNNNEYSLIYLPNNNLFKNLIRYNQKEIELELYEISFIEEIMNSYLDVEFKMNNQSQFKMNNENIKNYLERMLMCDYSLDMIINTLYMCHENEGNYNTYNSFYLNIYDNIPSNNLKIDSHFDLSIKPVMMHIQYFVLFLQKMLCRLYPLELKTVFEYILNFENYAIVHILSLFVKPLMNDINIYLLCKNMYLIWINKYVLSVTTKKLLINNLTDDIKYLQIIEEIEPSISLNSYI